MRTNEGSIPEMPPYFLGSLVLIKLEANPKADVVHGQQRLTTLTLLLPAIRANVSEGNGEHITTLLYEAGNPIKSTADRFRLTLRERDSDFFQKCVQREGGFEQLIELNGPLSDSQANLRKNARLFASRLASLSSS